MIMSMKKSSDTIGNQIRDLPVCSAMPQPLRHRVPIIIIIIIFSGSAAQLRLWPPRPRDFLITHNDAPQSVQLLWTSDQFVAETST
jgi:hypothetical protein